MCLDKYRAIVCDINSVNLADKSDQELKSLSKTLIKKSQNGINTDDLLIEAYALVKETAFRVLGLRTYDVQLLAAVAMHHGKLIEMQTGEGKTLSAVYPAYLAALCGKGVHILTFNDYLARRDAAQMGKVYHFLELSVGVIQEGMPPNERRQAYIKDITYMTAKEAGFDYLRDMLVYSTDDIVQRPFHYAIIDEADSILVDNAKNPLVIASYEAESELDYERITNAIRSLKAKFDYDTNDYASDVYLTDEGINKLESMLQCGNLYDSHHLNLLYRVNNALYAEVILKRDIDYLVIDGKVELIDNLTGRIAKNTRWSYGLQAAVESKEGLEIQAKGKIISQIMPQAFMHLYPKVCGMSGTLMDSENELTELYGLEIEVIPTNFPCIRSDMEDEVFTSKAAKYEAVIKEVLKANQSGRPVLIGTVSVKESDFLCDELAKSGIDCKVLNAKNDELEAEIISQAGALYAVTVSTNMAGRGVDIRLGGKDERDKEKVMTLGGLYVIGTNRHESRRIDNQLRGRAGRQGESGTTKFFIGLEDDLFQKYEIESYLPRKLKKISEAGSLSDKKVSRAIEQIQRTITGRNRQITKTLTDYTYLYEIQRKLFVKKRMELLGNTASNILETNDPGLYNKLLGRYEKEQIRKFESAITLFYMDKYWAEYLNEIESIKSGIHWAVFGGKQPLNEFSKELDAAFDSLQERIIQSVINELQLMLTSDEIIESTKKFCPASTWSYQVNDNPFEEDLGVMMMQNSGFSAISIILSWPLLLASLIYQRFFKRNKLVK